MNIWTWLKFVTFLWLLRKGFKLARWLMVVAAAAYPVPATTVTGQTATAAGRPSGSTAQRRGRWS